MAQRKAPTEADLAATREALLTDLKHLTEETQAVIKSSADEHFFDKAQGLRDALQNTLNNLSEDIQEGQAKIRRGIDQTEKQIRDQPLTAIGVAALAGLAIGLLMNRNR